MQTQPLDDTSPHVGEVGDSSMSGPVRPLSVRLSTSRVAAAFLLLGYAVHVALRTALAAGRFGPVNFADETGYLMNARFITDGPAGQMLNSMFYRGGYSLLIAPGYLLSDDPETSYQIILFINALLSSAVFPLLYFVVTRAFGVPTLPALAVSFVAALYPPLVLSSLFAMSENALYLLTLLSCALLVMFVRARTARQAWVWAVATGVLGGFLYTTHGRTAPTVAILILAFVVLAAVRRELRFPAVAGILVTLVVLFAGQLFNSYLLRSSWGAAAAGEDLNIVLDRLTSPGVAENIVVVGAGQYWYFIAGTFGLFALGVVEAVGQVRRPVDARASSTGTSGQVGQRGVPLLSVIRSRVGAESGGGPAAAAFLLLSLLSLVMLTAVFLYPPNRPDMIIYGRYSEVVLPAFLALGAYRLWHGSARRVVAQFAIGGGLTIVAYFLFAYYENSLVFGAISNSYTTLSMPALSQSITGLHPRRVLAIALVGMLLLGLLRRGRWRYLGAVGLVGALVLSSSYTRRELFTFTQHAVYGASDGAVIGNVPGLDTPQDIAYDVGHLTVEGRWGFQWQLNNTHFVLFDSTAGEQPPKVRYVISSQDWEQAERYGAELVWAATHGRQGIWLIPSNEPAPLTTTATN